MMNGPEENIYDRKLTLCPATIDWSVPELLEECPDCKRFLLYCCACNKRNKRRRVRYTPSHRPTRPCHHFRIVFTDGACMNNGLPEAKAGVGVAYGNNDGSQFSVPITDLEDDFPRRSNQRAELYAAQVGLEFLAEAERVNGSKPTSERKGEPRAWIIATDSEYVVKGMTEWLPTWKKNDFCTSKGTTPANLDMFLGFDDMLKEYEAEEVKVGFWHVPREYNKLADRLAKAAAVQGDVASM